jgi:hypothetical protein
VRDANRQALVYVYFDHEPGRRTTANLLTRDGAQRITREGGELPEWVRKYCLAIDDPRHPEFVIQADAQNRCTEAIRGRCGKCWEGGIEFS